MKGNRSWLKVLLKGTTSNRSAIGSRVTAHYGGKQQAQEVLAQSSFYSASDRRLHFGLGSENIADLTVRWTNGRIDQFPKVAANHLITIEEGKGIVGKQKF